MGCNMSLVALDSECMDGRYNVSCTAGAAAVVDVDSDGVMMKLVAKAVQE